MDRSHAIARLVGPVLCVIAIGLLANQATYREVAAEILGALPLVYLTGVLLLVAGLAILNAHPRWTPDWRSAVTAVGWIFTCGGTFRIIAPQFGIFVGTAATANAYFFTGAGLVLLAFGAFLTFKGYAV